MNYGGGTGSSNNAAFVGTRKEVVEVKILQWLAAVAIILQLILELELAVPGGLQSADRILRVSVAHIQRYASQR